MSRQDAAETAARAAELLTTTVNTHGLNAPETAAVARLANQALDQAHAAGATNTDIRNARRQ